MARVAREPRLPVRRILAYGAARSASEGLLAIRTLVLAPLLGPAAFGVWVLLRLSMRYAAFGTLGVPRGVEVEVAEQGGAADPAAVEARTTAARTALGFILIVFGTAGVAALAVSFLVRSHRWQLGLRGFAVAALAEQYWQYGLVYLRARSRLREYAQLEVVHAALQVACTVALALWWGLAGAFGGLALATLIASCFLPRDIPRRPALGRATLRRLLAVGFPLMLSVTLGTLLATSDRLVITVYGGTTLLGYYAFAASIAGVVGSVAWVIRTVVFAGTYAHARESGREEAVRSHLGGTVRPFARIFPPLLGVFALALPELIRVVVPRYEAAASAVGLLVFGAAAAGVGNLGAIAIVAARRQRVLPLVSGTVLLIEVLLASLALRAGLALGGVAAAAVGSQLLFAGTILWIAAGAASIANRRRLVAGTLAPLVWCAVVVAAIQQTLPTGTWSGLAIGIGVYVVALVPLGGVMRREVQAMRRVAPREMPTAERDEESTALPMVAE